MNVLRNAARIAPALLAALLLTASPASAGTAAESTVEQAWRYELRALGGRAGEVVMTLGGPRKFGTRLLRSVRIEARTDGMAARLFPAIADGTSWIDGEWLPVRADWTGSINTDKREIRYKYLGKRARGEYKKGGQVLLSLDEKAAARTVDTVSVITWVMSRDMVPGTEYQRPYFDGRRFFDMVATVGQPKEISLPVGLREAYPVSVRMTHKKIRYDMVIWVGVHDRVPYKTAFDFKPLGGLEMVLTSLREG
jgi:hypothetical protein